MQKQHSRLSSFSLLLSGPEDVQWDFEKVGMNTVQLTEVSLFSFFAAKGQNTVL